jgi:hypothetical protein
MNVLALPVSLIGGELLLAAGWYPCDLHEHNHLIARPDPMLHPAIYQALGRSVDESWVYPTPQQLFEQVLTTNDERFPMICDDLRLMPHHPPVLAEEIADAVQSHFASYPAYV